MGNPNDVVLSWEKIEQVHSYIKQHRPVSYKNLLRRYPEAVIAAPLLIRAGETNQADVLMQHDAEEGLLEDQAYEILGGKS